jgi:thymidylate kinase
MKVRVLPVLRALVESLSRSGVRYCHWKSNWRLPETLRGETDLDLLVHRADMPRFLSLVGALGLKPGSGEDHPSVCHCYGCDGESGRLFDLHVYYRIITGGTIKAYHLPVEEMLLRGARPTEAGVYVPEPAAELVLFVIRKSLDYAVASEVLIPREWKTAADELRWLMSQGATNQDARRLLNEYLPSVEFALFKELMDAIESGRWGVGRFRLGRALAARLRPYRRFAPASASLERGRRAWRKAWRTLRGGTSAQGLLSGGAVIGVVGSDGAGKSTVVGEVSRWLGEFLSVATIHGGKPPPSVPTALPRLVLPLLRRMLPGYRTTRIELRASEEKEPEAMGIGPLLVYALRALMLAYDRKQLLIRAHRKAANGTLVLSDRYPTRQPGVPEGAMLHFLREDSRSLCRWLAQMEERTYRTIPQPDLVLRLDVPLELAMQRNLTRVKPGGYEPSDYLRHRHALARELEFSGVPTYRIRADAVVEETVRAVKPILWNAL